MALSIKRSKLGWYFAGSAALALGVSLITPKPDVADYTNLLLVPDLAEELELDLATRIHFAHLGSSLLDSLGSGPDGALQLESYGADATKSLNVDQSMAFAERFRSGEIIAAVYSTDESSSVQGAAKFTLNFGWRPLGGEEEARSLTETAALLDNAHEWIPSEQVALNLLDHESNAVNSAAALWLNMHSTRHHGIVSRSRQALADESLSIGP